MTTTTLRRLAAVLGALTLLLGSGLLAQSAGASPATPYTQPILTASAACSGSGATVTASGDRFTPGATGTVSYNSSPAVGGSFTVGTDGTFSVPFAVASGSQGDTISASDDQGESVSTSFSVATTCSGTGGVTVSNSNPTAGSSITVSGTSCTPGSTVTVSLDGTTELATTTAQSDGSYSVVVTLPSGTTGSHNIVVSGPGAGCSGVEAISIAASDGGGLAGTGVAVVGLGAVGVVLLIGGGLMLMAGRRRKLTMV